MNNKTTVCLLFLLFPVLAHSQGKDFWKAFDGEVPQERRMESNTEITEFLAMELNVEAFKNYIVQSPQRGNGIKSTVIVDIPTADGEMRSFELFKTHTMSPGLAAKFPSISTYVGITGDKEQTIRLTLTNRGVFGMILGGEGDVFINPLNRSKTVYQIFNRKNAYRSANPMHCEFDNPEPVFPPAESKGQSMPDDGKLRTYDLAVSTTGEYSQFHINQAGVGGGTTAQKKAAVLAAVVVSINRINGIYERDLSLTMALVPNNDQIIYLNSSTDPFSNFNAGAMLNQNQNTIDNVIGFSNYDIGHVFSTGGGGIAILGSPCTTSKAMGVTGTPSPIGDFFDIDYVAHEMGHQFGANHTQNNQCQRNLPTAMEPGSGSTIMGYAGICPPNVQSHSDAYFHSISIDEINNNIRFGNSSGCDMETTIANSEPSITPVPNYTIPFGTAFFLTATVTDADNDAMTYCWEQADNNAAPMPPFPSNQTGPMFRSFQPDPSPTRYFPNINSVLAGDLSPTWEVIPNVARTMEFTLTVRDNNVLGGQTTTEDVTVIVANTGPFVINSQNNTGTAYDQNETFAVTWDVAGTTGNGINATNVDILLSYTGGAGGDFPVVLVQNTPNNGNQNVTAPIGTSSTNCRLMVRGSNNVFFDVNDTAFEITNVVAAVDEFSRAAFSITPNPNNGVFTLSFDGSVSGKATAKVFDIRGRLVGSYEFELSGGKEKTINLGSPQSGVYIVQVSDGNRKISEKLIVE